MEITLLSKTKLGTWSIIMMILNWLLFIAGSVFPWKSGFSGFEIVTQNPLQATITIIMLALGIATSSTGLTAVIKNKERSILVFLAILSGFYSIFGFFGSLATVFFG